MIFTSREEAGQLLAERLSKYKGRGSIILAIPRGGVVVGAEIAGKLGCPLDVIITRKLGAPGNQELAIGATTSKGGLVTDRELIDKLGITQNYLHSEHLKQLAEARRREKAYRSGKTTELINKNVIIVDDGVATGATMQAAIVAAQEELPSKVVVAVPVAPPETAERLGRLVNDFVVLHTPERFFAISEFYSSFPQISDEEVVQLLEQTDNRRVA